MTSLIDIQKQIAELQTQESEIKAREFNEKVAMIKEIATAHTRLAMTGCGLCKLSKSITAGPNQCHQCSRGIQPSTYDIPGLDPWPI